MISTRLGGCKKVRNFLRSESDASLDFTLNNIEEGLVNGAMGIITETVWPLFRRNQIYNTDIPSVHIGFDVKFFLKNRLFQIFAKDMHN
ncbi:hypothetical protein TNIN_367101 [Trichonephila inaurata madagascariensis]|uniref:Uncharacterized protein n=1 Tax=Trichonephila inaurata madagascariensis TaxID=2747483 RepID=A0A8X7C3Z3_9ARAC|nr:hypothetical protein TNIN_367101 [Trichonephila inaurata madagascariensis]